MSLLPVPWASVLRAEAFFRDDRYNLAQESRRNAFRSALAAAVRDSGETTALVYMDGSVNTRICTDELHGCGYVGRDGQRRGTYNVFGNRELLKRLHTLIYQLKGEDGIVDLHFSVDYNAPAAAWATSARAASAHVSCTYMRFTPLFTAAFGL